MILAHTTIAEVGSPTSGTRRALLTLHVRWGNQVILKSMTYRVGPKGQVVIPKVLRDQLGIAPGDEIDFSLDDDVLHLKAVRPASNLKGSLSGIKLIELLEADRRAERDH